MVKTRQNLSGKAGTESHFDHQQLCEKIEALGLEHIRFSFADQHGVLRGKTLPADQVASVLSKGCTITSTLLAKDTSHKTVFQVWQPPQTAVEKLVTGAGDITMIPDPATFTVLPWLEKTGWMLCDLQSREGTPVTISSREILKRATHHLAAKGMRHMCGLEIEFHVFRLDDPHNDPRHAALPGRPPQPPEVSYLSRGAQYLTDNTSDLLEPVMNLLATACKDLGLPLRSMECEFGPSQFEFTFHPQEALKAADDMMLFRSMVKQVCRRNGLHATFMSRPQLENIMSSGWHLHQSLSDIKTGKNRFMPQANDQYLSEIGMQFTAGLLKHAKASCAFACPTINAYKRFQPFMLAPDQIVWGNDNKGAMIRIIASTGDDASRLENRIGEPAANPYLYFASQIYAGLDGIDKKLECGPPAETPYEGNGDKLPDSLETALSHLGNSAVMRAGFGDEFVDYFHHIKTAEINRFKQAVTDWEHREYFENF